jgi:hypothetical protein
VSGRQVKIVLRYEQLAMAINALDIQSTLMIYKKSRPLLVQVFKEFSKKRPLVISGLSQESGIYLTTLIASRLCLAVECP